MQFLIKFFLNFIPRHYLHYLAPLGLKIISLFLRGNKYEDPITSITYSRLLPYGRVHPRQNALAPDSISLERHRLFWLYLKEKTDFFYADLKVLHLAPELCFLKKFKKMSNLTYTTADLNSPWADVHFDVQDIPYKDESFDVVIANHLLEHIEDDIKAMTEFYRIMKKGGWGIFMVPVNYGNQKTFEDKSITKPEEREKHFWQDDHFRLYGQDYIQRLASVGFKVKIDNYSDTLPQNLIDRYALTKGEKVFFCQKR